MTTLSKETLTTMLSRLLTLTSLAVAISARVAAAQPANLDQTFAALRNTEKRLGPNAIVSGGARSLFASPGIGRRLRPALPDSRRPRFRLRRYRP